MLKHQLYIMIYGRSCHFYYSVLSTSLIIKCWRSKSYSWVFNGSETKTRVHMKTWDFWSKKLLKLVLVLKHSPSSSIFCVKFSSSQQIRNSGLPFVYICFPLIFFFLNDPLQISMENHLRYIVICPIIRMWWRWKRVPRSLQDVLFPLPVGLHQGTL